MTLGRIRRTLRRSKKFCEWGNPKTATPGDVKLSPPRMKEEKDYTPAELAELWGVSTELVCQLFRSEPGVLKIGQEGTRFRRRYKTLRIPESVAERVHTRLSS